LLFLHSFGGGGGYGGGGGSRFGGGGSFGSNKGGLGDNLRTIDWSQVKLPVFQKDFYQEAPTVAAMTEEEVRAWRQEVGISVQGTGIPKPIRTFEESQFPGKRRSC